MATCHADADQPSAYSRDSAPAASSGGLLPRPAAAAAAAEATEAEIVTRLRTTGSSPKGASRVWLSEIPPPQSTVLRVKPAPTTKLRLPPELLLAVPHSRLAETVPLESPLCFVPSLSWQISKVSLASFELTPVLNGATKTFSHSHLPDGPTEER